MIYEGGKKQIEEHAKNIYETQKYLHGSPFGQCL